MWLFEVMLGIIWLFVLKWFTTPGLDSYKHTSFIELFE